VSSFSEITQPLFFEMIRSFTALARSLNLSHAVKELGSTRQTVRRHIAQLEAAKGAQLFVIEDRQYQLTEAGQRALPEAMDILSRGRSWLNGIVSHLGGLQHVHTPLPEGRSFWLQQRKMGDIWTSERTLLRESYRAWAMAGGALEAPEMDHVRPYFMVYRDSPNGWICVEIGDESSYVTWSGWAPARSIIGRNVNVLPGGDEFAHLMVEPFEDVARYENARLDHIYTQLKRDADGPYFPLCYRRLLLSGRFPDGSFALISVVDRHKGVEIDGVDQAELDTMPAEVVMPVSPSLLKYEHKLPH
jgi:biotin operon repressor